MLVVDSLDGNVSFYCPDTLVFLMTSRPSPRRKVSSLDRCTFWNSPWINTWPRIRKLGSDWQEVVSSTLLLLTMALGSSLVRVRFSSNWYQRLHDSIRFRSRPSIRRSWRHGQGPKIRLDSHSRYQSALFGMFRSIESDENHSLPIEQRISVFHHLFRNLLTIFWRRAKSNTGFQSMIAILFQFFLGQQTRNTYTHTHTRTNKVFLSTINDLVNIPKNPKINMKLMLTEKNASEERKTTTCRNVRLDSPFRRYKINHDYSYGLWNRLLLGLSDTKTKLKLNDRQSEREREIWFELPRIFVVLSLLHIVTVAVRGAVGMDGDEETAVIDDCLHLVHLNSSFFFTLVKPTQTRWNHRSHASQQTPAKEKRSVSFSTSESDWHLMDDPLGFIQAPPSTAHSSSPPPVIVDFFVDSWLSSSEINKGLLSCSRSDFGDDFITGCWRSTIDET